MFEPDTGPVVAPKPGRHLARIDLTFPEDTVVGAAGKAQNTPLTAASLTTPIGETLGRRLARIDLTFPEDTVIVSLEVLTAEPVDVALRPVLATALRATSPAKQSQKCES